MDDPHALLPLPDPRTGISEGISTSYDDTLAQAGQIADAYTRQNRFQHYQQTRPVNTLRRQAADLRLFATYLAEAGVHRDGEALFTDPAAGRVMTAGVVEGFLRWQARKGYAIATINGRLATVKTYCREAHAAQVITAENMTAITSVRGYSHKDGRNLDRQRARTRVGAKKAATVLLTRLQAAQLKRQSETREGPRDALLMCLLLDHGLRCGEIAGLMAAHIHLADGTLSFYREKVDKEQQHTLTAETLLAAAQYLPTIPPDGPLFPGYRGRPMTKRAINLRVGVLGKRLGITALSPHDCRHYWVTSAVRGGTDVNALQHAGGWSSPTMPLLYADKSGIANKDVKLG